MASPQAQRQERTPSTISALLGLVQNTDGNWSVAEVPTENLEETMNERSARLVQAGLKQQKSEVLSALASSQLSSFHAVQWIIDAKNWYENLSQYHSLPCALYPFLPLIT